MKIGPLDCRRTFYMDSSGAADGVRRTVFILVVDHEYGAQPIFLEGEGAPRPDDARACADHSWPWLLVNIDTGGREDQAILTSLTASMYQSNGGQWEKVLPSPAMVAFNIAADRVVAAFARAGTYGAYRRHPQPERLEPSPDMTTAMRRLLKRYGARF